LQLSVNDPEALNGLGLIECQRNRPREAINCFNRALAERPDYAPALLNLAVISQNSPGGKSLALQKYHEYLAVKPRPANWEAVNTVAQQLQQELTPPKPVAVAVAEPPRPAPQTNTVRPPVTNVSPPKPEVAATNPVQAPPPTNRSVQPTPKPEMVKVGDAPPIQIAATNALTSHSASPSNVVPPVYVVSNTPADKPGLLARMNPVNLLHRDAKTGVSTNSGGVSKTVPVTVRYTYFNPAKPAIGNRAEAERQFAQGVMAQQEARSGQALELFQAAVQADPSFFDAQFNLAQAAADAGDEKLALPAYETALAINPGSFNARYSFALALSKAGYIQDAAVELERLIAGSPASESPARLAVAHLAVANLYAGPFHQPTYARPHYVKVLELDPQNTQATSIRYWLRDNP
jgi:tetratricopeptide (TPR) repeat protein